MKAAMRIFSKGFAPVLMRLALACLLASGVAHPVFGQSDTIFQMDYTNAPLTTPHWRLTLHPDGSGQFDAEAGQPSASSATTILAGEVHRQLQLEPDFTAQIFAAARQSKFFSIDCESHLKVAFEGKKRLSYTGPDGNGSCEYNYSRIKQIDSLSTSVTAVANTLLYGARLEKMEQHDRLGLDQELLNLSAAVNNGDARQICSIRELLTGIAANEQVLDRARRTARTLIAEDK